MRSKNYTFIILVLIFVIFGNTSNLSGKHFTFNVPVSLYNLCDCIEGIKVKVYVTKMYPVRSGSATHENKVAEGIWTHDLNGQKDLNITAKLSFDAFKHKNPNDAKGYKATIRFKVKGNGGYIDNTLINDVGCNCAVDFTKPTVQWVKGMIPILDYKNVIKK